MPRWGLGDVVLGLVLGLLGSVVVTAAVLVVRGYDAESAADQFTLADQAIAQAGLWFGLLGVPLWASWRKGNGPVADYHLRQRWFDIPMGLAAGAVSQLILVPLLYLPLAPFINEDDLSEPAEQLTSKAEGSTLGAMLLVLVVVIGAPIIEEIFFRGLTLRSIDKRFGMIAAILGSSLIFGVFHFQPLQFPALFMFGLVAAYLVRATDRLGPAIWAHVAFNGITVFALLCDCVGDESALGLLHVVRLR
jgi:hypothetical protein